MANAIGPGLSGIDRISVDRHVSRAVANLVDVALKEIRIENRSNAEHSGLTFFLATFVIGQLVLTRRMSSVLGYESRAIRTSGAHHLDCHEEYGPEHTATILDLCLHAPAGIKIGDAHVAPNGKVRLATVKPPARNRRPLPMRRPAAREP
jgi:hypothetical protein